MSQNNSNSNEVHMNETPQIEETTSVITVEITHDGSRVFDGVLPNSQLRDLWTKVFERKLSEIDVYNFRQFPGRCLRVTYQLKAPIKLAEVHPTPEFNFFHKTLGQAHLLIGKILGYHTIKEPKIGEEVLVTVLKNTDISPQNILKWLGHFGEVVGNYFYAKDAEGVSTGAFHTKLVLEHHIPEHLPMFGQKIRVYYAGMQRQCSNCYRVGHFKRECNKRKTDWLGYIERLLDTGIYDESLFGNWIEVINDKAKQQSRRNDVGRRDRRSRSPQSPKRRYNGQRRLHDGRRGRSPQPTKRQQRHSPERKESREQNKQPETSRPKNDLRNKINSNQRDDLRNKINERVRDECYETPAAKRTEKRTRSNEGESSKPGRRPRFNDSDESDDDKETKNKGKKATRGRGNRGY
jgi:hypothetical protein